MIHADLMALEQKLRAQVRGQGHVIERVAAVLRRGEQGLTAPGRPRGSFLFLGPTGVGKTELCKSFSRELFGSERLIRFDMSEYQSKESLPTLLGDHSGHEGRLGQALLQNGEQPAVLLFDEMEKAHREILDIFLQILDDARVTTGSGTIHDLSNYYVVLTSNVGSERIAAMKKSSHQAIQRTVKAALLQAGFRPEFLGRFNELLVFNKLNYDVLKEIAELLLDQEANRLSDLLAEQHGRSVSLELTPQVLHMAIRNGYDNYYGARPMRAYVERALQEAVSDHLLAGASNGVFDVVENKITVLPEGDADTVKGKDSAYGGDHAC